VRLIDALVDKQRDRLQSFITGLEGRVLSDNIQAREYWAITQVSIPGKEVGTYVKKNLLYFKLEFEVNWPEPSEN